MIYEDVQRDGGTTGAGNGWSSSEFESYDEQSDNESKRPTRSKVALVCVDALSHTDSSSAVFVSKRHREPPGLFSWHLKNNHRESFILFFLLFFIISLNWKETIKMIRTCRTGCLGLIPSLWDESKQEASLFEEPQISSPLLRRGCSSVRCSTAAARRSST